jgi:hypothetical protein
MQVRNSKQVLAPYSSSIVCGVSLVKKHGVLTGLYSGFGATVAREIPQYVPRATERQSGIRSAATSCEPPSGKAG